MSIPETRLVVKVKVTVETGFMMKTKCINETIEVTVGSQFKNFTSKFDEEGMLPEDETGEIIEEEVAKWGMENQKYISDYDYNSDKVMEWLMDWQEYLYPEIEEECEEA